MSEEGCNSKLLGDQLSPKYKIAGKPKFGERLGEEGGGVLLNEESGSLMS